jgi:hypothetical protein
MQGDGCRPFGSRKEIAMGNKDKGNKDKKNLKKKKKEKKENTQAK